MVNWYCSVPDCGASVKKKRQVHKYPYLQDVTFHKFPSLKRQRALRYRWTRLLRRAPDWRPNRFSSVCSRHFVGGEPTEENPVPELFPYNNWKIRPISTSIVRRFSVVEKLEQHRLANSDLLATEESETDELDEDEHKYEATEVADCDIDMFADTYYDGVCNEVELDSQMTYYRATSVKSLTVPVTDHDYIYTYQDDSEVSEDESTSARTESTSARTAKFNVISIAGDNSGPLPSNKEDSEDHIKDFTTTQTSTQTTLTTQDIEQLHKAEMEFKQLHTAVSDKDSMLRSLFLEKVLQNDKTILYYTGFPNKILLQDCFDNLVDKFHRKNKYTFIEKCEKNKNKNRGPNRKVKNYDEFIMTLIRLKVGIPQSVIQHMFGISQSSVSSIIGVWKTLILNNKDKLPQLLQETLEKKQKQGTFHELI